MKNYLKPGELKLGDLFYTNTLEGLTPVEINQGGRVVFIGLFKDLTISFYPISVKYIHLDSNRLIIDIYE